MVDLKGIEPSNLSDANRTLSQLSYVPTYMNKNQYSAVFIKTQANRAKQND